MIAVVDSFSSVHCIFAMAEPSGEVIRIVEVYEEIQNEVKESQLQLSR